MTPFLEAARTLARKRMASRDEKFRRRVRERMQEDKIKGLVVGQKRSRGRSGRRRNVFNQEPLGNECRKRLDYARLDIVLGSRVAHQAKGRKGIMRPAKRNKEVGK